MPRGSSLPTRGAWIEIISHTLSCTLRVRRSPHGERGLKFSSKTSKESTRESLPTRGAWIEINGLRHLERGKEWSLPTRGAWIEIIRA